ncbi:hypothetical protein RRG08_000580 [Elysia crispata]|uniref:Uncharacterized protein n=1 Tax=Elysia crispata TaxID=231223 RepID=A0AAE0Y8C3_9GAST|nr:hypothetical protein RRG08_000580 [Elysia crispata]
MKNCASTSRAVASGKASIQSVQDLYNFCIRDLSVSPSVHCADDHIVRTFELGSSQKESSPQDDHLDPVASSPREVHLYDRDSFFAHFFAELSVCSSVEAVQAIAS